MRESNREGEREREENMRGGSKVLVMVGWCTCNVERAIV